MGDAEFSSAHADAIADARVGSARRRFRLVARAAALLCLGVVLVPVVVRLTGWEAGPLAYAVSFLPWVVLACMVPLVFAVLGRSRVLMAAVLVPFVLGVVWLAPLYGSAHAVSTSGVELRVATINATLGQADADSIVRMVHDRSIDVLAVAELTPSEAAALRAAGLDMELPYRELLPQLGVEGTGVWSRLALNSAKSAEGLTAHAVRVSVMAGKQQVTLFAVHPAAPGLFDHSRWANDMGALAGILSTTDGPVIVAGDFNTTRDHRAFRGLEALGFKDAVDQAGAGFLPTFPNGGFPMPVVAIDHVMVRDSRLSAVSATTVAISGADHRALVVAYGWQD